MGDVQGRDLKNGGLKEFTRRGGRGRGLITETWG